MGGLRRRGHAVSVGEVPLPGRHADVRQALVFVRHWRRWPVHQRALEWRDAAPRLVADWRPSPAAWACLTKGPVALAPRSCRRWSRGNSSIDAPRVSAWPAWLGWFAAVATAWPAPWFVAVAAARSVGARRVLLAAQRRALRRPARPRGAVLVLPAGPRSAACCPGRCCLVPFVGVPDEAILLGGTATPGGARVLAARLRVDRRRSSRCPGASAQATSCRRFRFWR